MTSTVRVVQRFFLFGSLAGMLIGAVMFFVSPELYTRVRDPGDEWISRNMWFFLFVLSLFGLLISAVLYTIKLPEDDKGPIIIRR